MRSPKKIAYLVRVRIREGVREGIRQRAYYRKQTAYYGYTYYGYTYYGYTH